MPEGKRVVHYSPLAAERAKRLRREMTIAEAMLWRELKGRRIAGVDFHRQKPVGRFIVDFYAPKLMLAIEVDGDSHRDREVEDLARQRELESVGVRFLRFDDLEVRRDPWAVAQTIEQWVLEHRDDKG